MENNGLLTQTQGNGTQPEEKTFTQEEVNKIVQERLARVKTSQGPSEKEIELQQRENDLYIREQIANNGLPNELYDSLKGLDKKAVDKCLSIVSPYIRKASEPVLNPVLPTGGNGGDEDKIRRAMGLLRR